MAKVVFREATSALIKDEVARYLELRDRDALGRRPLPHERIEAAVSARVEAGRLEQNLRQAIERLIAPTVRGEVVFL